MSAAGDFMTVGELREILERYDGDRLITCNARVFERVISGVVAIITAPKMTVDPTTCMVKQDRESYWIPPLFGMGGSDES